MKNEEWKFLKSYLNADNVMLEYGSGNSTMCIAPLVKELYSIEHDTKWYNSVLELTKDLNNVNLNLVEQDKTRTHPTKIEEFQTYVNWIKNKDIKFNRVLVDGRAIVWCAEAVLDKLEKDHIVFLHDYNLKERPYYEQVTKYYNIFDSCFSMIAMRKK
jgi:hypothetical protein